MNFVFNMQTFATTYTTATPTQTTATSIDSDTTIPAIILEDVVDKKGLSSYAKKVTALYDKRYLRSAEIKFVSEEDIDEIVNGLDDEATVQSGGNDNP